MNTDVAKRLRFEQQLLPNKFFASEYDWITDLIKYPSTTLKELAGPIPIHAESMLRNYIRANHTLLIVRLEMNPPIFPGECRAVYLCYCFEDNVKAYITSELTSDGDYYLCCRTEKNGYHILCGASKYDVDDDFDIVSEIFWELDMGISNEMKIYLPVDVEFNADGTMLPRSLTWIDGSKYEIDRVLDIRPAPALKAGGQGDRYKVRIRGQVRYLFFERNASQMGNNIGKWFVEKKS